MKMTTTQVFWRDVPLGQVFWDSLHRFMPNRLINQPIIFLVAIGMIMSFLATLYYAAQDQAWGYSLSISFTLLITVWLSNFSIALAKTRGRGVASRLIQKEQKSIAKLWHSQGETTAVPVTQLKRGDKIYVEANNIIPLDGEIVEGMATLNESAVTGESAPVLRQADGETSSVTAGSKVLSDWLIIKITHPVGTSVLDNLMELVENKPRQKTPNEIALSILLNAVTLVTLVVVLGMIPASQYLGLDLSLPILIALLVCLIPTTIGGLLPVIGISGMDRALKNRYLAKSGDAVEMAGSIDILLLDKTGTITTGERRANELFEVGHMPKQTFYQAAYNCSLQDETIEGQSIIELITPLNTNMGEPNVKRVIEFSAETRLSGVDLEDGTRLRKGAVQSVIQWLKSQNKFLSPELEAQVEGLVEKLARKGRTPIAVANQDQLLGIISLKDVIKPDIKLQVARMRILGIQTIMITGDNPLTTATIAADAGVDDFIAEATPEKKLDYILAQQQKGYRVAMVGDGINDAPALAQADLGIVMNTGDAGSRKAGNIVDLESNPAKLPKLVKIGKQLLITRGALTTFSFSSDVAKYFVLLPALFSASLPAIAELNFLQLSSAENIVLSALIANAMIILIMIPVAMHGVRFHAFNPHLLMSKNLFIFGVGGFILPFILIKLIDLALISF